MRINSEYRIVRIRVVYCLRDRLTNRLMPPSASKPAVAGSGTTLTVMLRRKWPPDVVFVNTTELVPKSWTAGWPGSVQ